MCVYVSMSVCECVSVYHLSVRHSVQDFLQTPAGADGVRDEDDDGDDEDDEDDNDEDGHSS